MGLLDFILGWTCYLCGTKNKPKEIQCRRCCAIKDKHASR